MKVDYRHGITTVNLYGETQNLNSLGITLKYRLEPLDRGVWTSTRDMFGPVIL